MSLPVLESLAPSEVTAAVLTDLGVTATQLLCLPRRCWIETLLRVLRDVEVWTSAVSKSSSLAI